MPDVVQGNNVLLYCNVDGTNIAVGCATSITFRFENELIGKTDVNAGLFRKKRVRISNASASVQGLITLYNTSSRLSAFYFFQEGVRRSEQALTFIFTDQGGIQRQITGNFLIEVIETTAQTGDMAEFDIDFEGTGAVVFGEIESPPDPTCFETFSDWWLLNPGDTSISGLGSEGRSFAGQEVLEVIREAGPPLAYTSGTPNDREYAYDGTTITLWSENPGDGNERVFVLWQEIV